MATLAVAIDPVGVGASGQAWLHVNGQRHRLGEQQLELDVPAGQLRVLAEAGGLRSDLLVGQIGTTDRVDLSWRAGLLGDSRTDIVVLDQIAGPSLQAVDVGHERRLQRRWIIGMVLWMLWTALVHPVLPATPWWVVAILWALAGSVAWVRWRRRGQRLLAVTATPARS